MSLFDVEEKQERDRKRRNKKAAFWTVFQEKFGEVSIPEKRFGTLVRVESADKVEELQVREDEDWELLSSTTLDVQVTHKDFDQRVVVVKEAKNV